MVPPALRTDRRRRARRQPDLTDSRSPTLTPRWVGTICCSVCQVERKKKNPDQGKKSTLTLSGDSKKGQAKGKVVRTDATRAARRDAEAMLQTRPLRTCRRDSWTPEQQDKLKEMS